MHAIHHGQYFEIGLLDLYFEGCLSKMLNANVRNVFRGKFLYFAFKSAKNSALK